MKRSGVSLSVSSIDSSNGGRQGPSDADESEYSMPYLPFFFSVCTHTRTRIHLAAFSASARVSRYQKEKPSLDFTGSIF